MSLRYEYIIKVDHYDKESGVKIATTTEVVEHNTRMNNHDAWGHFIALHNLINNLHTSKRYVVRSIERRDIVATW